MMWANFVAHNSTQSVKRVWLPLCVADFPNTACKVRIGFRPWKQNVGDLFRCDHFWELVGDQAKSTGKLKPGGIHDLS